jgi:hypothetical protein
MGKKKPDEQGDLDLLHEWLAATGGSIELGATSLQSAETSKSGSKLTIVLKKNKPEKKSGAADNDA